MRVNFKRILMIAGVLFLGACAPAAGTDAPSEPILIAEATLPPPTPAPTLSPLLPSPTAAPSQTPTLWPTMTPTRRASLPRWFATEPPLTYTATLRPVPALPMLSTPTPTPSHTPAPTRSPAQAAKPTGSADAACPYRWFFVPSPSTCPTGDALRQPALYQPFEHGTMIGFEDEGMILVLFQSAEYPRWLLIPNTYTDDQPPTDPAILPPRGYFQPERGLGLAWRTVPTIRERLGWAVTPSIGYTAISQLDSVSGTRYVQGPSRQVYVLPRDQATWYRAGK